MAKPFLSIIVPVYNEQARLETVPEISKYLKKLKFKTELIIVNDGSTDKTLRMLKSLKKKHSFQIVSYKQNMGKGHAIMKGMLAAQGSWRLFMDVDLSVPLKTIEELVPILKKKTKPDIVIATRRTEDAEIIASQQPLRQSLGEAFFRLTSWWLNLHVSDITCGFKCFSAKATDKIFPQMLINRWAFDAEMLALAEKQGFKIAELPVSWTNDERSKVRFPQDLINSFTDLWQIKINFLTGRYSTN